MAAKKISCHAGGVMPAETGEPTNREIMDELRRLRRDFQAALPEIRHANRNADAIAERKRKEAWRKDCARNAAAQRFPRIVNAEK